MHVPDGYVSPQTCVVALAATVPFWVVATRKVSDVVKTKDVPLLAMFAALSFLVMMFNIPLPGGTSAHAVGAVVVAIVLGPWAAVVALSVALLLQALVFGDGGVLAFGVNTLILAVVMPFVGLAAYRLVAGRSALTSRRRTVAAGVGGYVGINAAGLATAVFLGVQPMLFHTADGTPLYSPYTLAQTLPAMAVPHLTLAGAAEAVLTAGVLAYLVRAAPGRLAATHPDPVVAVGPSAGSGPPVRPRRVRPATVAGGFVVALVGLCPLGLLAPGETFGEAAPEDLDLAGLGLRAVPEGMERFAGFWSHTLIADYGFGEGQNPVLGYWVSALLGVAVVGVVVYLLGRVVEAVVARRGPGQPEPPRGRTTDGPAEVVDGTIDLAAGDVQVAVTDAV
ncbi:MAG: cobalt transporter CbiM [Micrococcales bacterium]|nr:cobalt transporter CbiM [Micrococcales bacterium]